MRKSLLFLLLLPFGLIAQQLDVQSPIRFLALGDSYTIGESVPSAQNWPHQLRDSLTLRSKTTDTLRIIATTGWRTDNLLSAIQNQNLDAVNYNLASVLIGVNNQFQGRPFSQYVTEFPRLVDSAIRYVGEDTSHVFIVSIPDYAYTPYGQSTTNPSQISAQLDTYNLYAKAYADSLHIRFFDITPISRQGLNDPALVAPDGLHPSAKQYSQWVHLMLQTIDSAAAVSTGISTFSKENNINIYPNPVKDKMTVAVNDANASIQIFDLMGQKIIDQNSIGDIDMSSFSVGLYTIKISSGDKQFIRKIVKE